MTIHMLCSECGSALNVRDDLAGTVRHCPKCKVELHIPVAVGGPPPSDMELEAMSAGFADAEAPRQSPASSLRNGGVSESDDVEDGEDRELGRDSVSEGDDGTAEMQASDDTREIDAQVARVEPEARNGAPSSNGKTPATSQAAGNEDEDFDPVAFLNEAPAGSAPPRSAAPRPKQAPVDRPQRREPADRPRPPEPVVRQRREEPERGSEPVAAPVRSSTVSGASAAADLWDHAKAVKQLRKAMKDGSAEMKQHDAREPAIDWSGMAREVGLKGVGILLIGLLAAAGAYYGFDSMMGGGIKLPKLGYVEGVATLDGQPVVGATVYFSPIEGETGGAGGERVRTSTAITDEKGHFKMLYIDRIAGVAVGRNRVWISAVGAPTAINIPPDFGEGSMVLREVKEGNQTIDIEMKGAPTRAAARR
ncbi:MAG TPA: hypothetical protein VL132_07460 [Planctomycetaceae bacterium]|nr:hypothetical protein [Planctomycetaceae bacterium]